MAHMQAVLTQVTEATPYDAPPFTLTNLNGKVVNASDDRGICVIDRQGKVRYVNVGPLTTTNVERLFRSWQPTSG